MEGATVSELVAVVLLREVIEVDYAVEGADSVEVWRGMVEARLERRCSGGELASAELATKAEDSARRGAADCSELQDSHRRGDQTELCSDPVPGLDQQQRQSSVAQVGVVGPKQSGCSSCVEEFEGQSRRLLAGGLHFQSSPTGHHHHLLSNDDHRPEQ